MTVNYNQNDLSVQSADSTVILTVAHELKKNQKMVMPAPVDDLCPCAGLQDQVAGGCDHHHKMQGIFGFPTT